MGILSNSKECLQAFLKSFISLLYPPLCLHCKKGLPNDSKVFCTGCHDLLTLIHPEERCRFCFSADIYSSSRICRRCAYSPSLMSGAAAAFDYAGPAATLIRRLKYANMPYLASGAAAYMAAQFLQLNWPFPDYIIPVPITRLHKLERGYNQSLLLAQELASLLNRPIVEAVYRKSGDYSQAGLSRKQREQLQREAFRLHTNTPLTNKTLLLVDDVMTTGTTLQRCIECLQEAYPAEVYGLTFCKALK